MPADLSEVLRIAAGVVLGIGAATLIGDLLFLAGICAAGRLGAGRRRPRRP